MRLLQHSRWQQQSLLLLAATTSLVTATPFPKDDIHDLGYSFLMPRGCSTYCGSGNGLCCDESQACTTIGNQPSCVAKGGGWVPQYTSTWTRTYTSTIMTWFEPAPEPTAGVDCVPKDDTQEACGSICCAGWQTCAAQGQCSAKPGYEEPSTIVITSGGVTTTQYSAPYRITGTTVVVSSGAMSTGTATGGAGEPTATGDSEAVGAGGGNNSGLSGGEIAGIVIGAIAGAILLCLLAFCCIARGLWAMICGGKRKTREEVIEERYSRHGSRPASTHSHRTRHSGWFGGSGRANEKRKSSGKRWLGLAGLAATLLALLNLRKEKKPVSKSRSRSRYSESYYSYTGTDPSSSSSGRRTHYTRRTGGGGSRAPRSQYSKSSRRS